MLSNKNYLKFFLFVLMTFNISIAQKNANELKVNVCSFENKNLNIETGEIFIELKYQSKNYLFDNKIIEIYPNPIKDKVNILTNIKIEEVEIFSAEGKSIYYVKSQDNIFDLSFLNKGFYLIVINKNLNFKILKI